MTGNSGALGSQAPGLRRFSVMRGLRGGLHSWESDLAGAPWAWGWVQGVQTEGFGQEAPVQGQGRPRSISGEDAQVLVGVTR